MPVKNKEIQYDRFPRIPEIEVKSSSSSESTADGAEQETQLVEQAEEPMSLLLAMTTFSGGMYVFCITLSFVASRCRTWCKDWNSVPVNPEQE